MPLSDEKRRFNELYSIIGKRGLNSLFPNDFELYIFAFELMNYKWETIDYFILPVGPGSIEETKPKATSVTKTSTGVVSLRNSSFIPTDISISGTFGRRFKILLGDNIVDLEAQRIQGDDADQESGNIKKAVFSTKVKTGYGCMKVLESIFDKATLTDDKMPRTLVFYNLASGNNYVIEPSTLSLNQSENARQIWYYSMNMQSLAKIEHVTNRSLREVTAQISANEMIQSYANKYLNRARQALSI